MSARVYTMKPVNGCKDMSIMSPQDVCCKFFTLLSTNVCSQNINKQGVNIPDGNLTDYSFLSRYHYTKSKNYLKRRYRIRHWIPMFIGTPCTEWKSVIYYFYSYSGNGKAVVLIFQFMKINLKNQISVIHC